MSDSRTHTPTPVPDDEYLRRLAENVRAHSAPLTANEMVAMADRMATSRASHDGLVEALRFYADAKNWEEQPGYESRAYDDDGDIARRALEAAGITEAGK